MMMKIIIISLCLLLGTSASFAQVKCSLKECQRMAAENNNRIKAGKWDVEAASQTRKEAFTSYFPSVSGTGTYFRADKGLVETSIETQGLIPPELAAILPAGLLGMLPSSIPVSLLKDGTMAGVTATQPVFAGGRIINGNKLAKVGEKVARLQLQLTEEQVELTTATYFWQVENLKDKLETIAVVGNLLATLHKEVGMAVKAGLTTNNDLLRVELQMQQTESDRLKVENGTRVCKMQLAQFIGADMETFDTETCDSEASTLPNSLYRDATATVMNRTEMKLLDSDVKAAQLRTSMSLGQQLPSLGIGGGYLYHNLLGNSTNRGLLFASVSIPISGWWGGTHAINRHRAMKHKAEVNRVDNMELMIVETNQVWNEVTETYKQMGIAEKSIRSSTENLRIVTESYKAGTVPLSELLDAQLLFQQSKNLYSDAYSVYQMKVLKYKQITLE